MALPPNQIVQNGMIQIPWTEVVPGNSTFSSWTMSFGYNGNNQAVLEFLINWSDWLAGSAEQQFLGYPTRNPGATVTLTRNIPARHPYKSQLWATRIISARGQGRMTKVNDPVNGSYSSFEKVRLQVLFESLEYDVYNDSDNQKINAGVEFGRFCTFGYEETAEFLTRPLGDFLYAETAGVVTANQALTAPLGQILVKEGIQVTWYQLPEIGLFTALLPNGLPTKIQNCIGHVNNGTFFGRGAATLLLLPPKFTPIIAPVPPQIIGLPANSPSRLWNVTLTFKYFSPPTVDGVEANRGWNSVPAVKDNNWYKIGANNAGVAGNPLYPTADFTQIFTMN